jgi:16S rRNA (guanine(966)-N(2))-methyltransferase RsmD
MRVTSGTAKGKTLKSVPGDSTRPVMDKVKQAVFNILMDDVRGSRWLDLFGGTGAIGIEALSRGAASCVFLDIEQKAIKTIEANLAATKLAAGARVVRQDAFRFLGGRPNAAYDFVYIAPPQYKGLWSRAMTLLDQQPGWLAENGTIMIQIDPAEYTPLTLVSLELEDERRYGGTLLCFYGRQTADGQKTTDGGRQTTDG